MIRAAIAGVGFMGWIHYLAYGRSSHANLHAFCELDPAKRAGDWTSIKGNFGPPGERISMDGLTAYASLQEMLADPDIDLVDICLPPSLHVEAACQALEAGKHVLCEKPLGLSTEECDRIVAAAERADRKILVAHVLSYMGEYRFIHRTAVDGTYGVPKRGYFKRVISPPDWIPNFYSPTEIGGPLFDLHVHDTHFIRLLFGMPKRVMCSAEMKNGLVKFCQTLMEFDEPGIIVGTSSGVSDQTARPFCQGFEIQFERAAAQFELAALNDGAETMPLMVLGQDGQAIKPELEGGDEISGFVAEIDDAVRSIQTGTTVPKLDGALARDAIHICQCLQASADCGEWVNCK